MARGTSPHPPPRKTGFASTLLAGVLAHPTASFAGLVMTATASGIMANALVMQPGAHPAPLFVGTRPLSTDAVPARPAAIAPAATSADAATQAVQCCKNVLAILESQGMTAANLVKVTVFITDITAFGSVNEVYKQYFTEPCPARSCVEVSALPLGAKVEIESIAAV